MSRQSPSSIEISDLTLAYDRVPAVHHLSGRFASGSMTAIVGPNGAGKSTLLKGIAGLLTPSEGAIRIAGAKRGDIAFLPQQSEIDRSFPMSVFDAAALGLWRELGLFGALDASRKARVRAALETVGLSARADDTLGSLSVGQVQRVLFARLLLQDAPIILLDEPFAAIDERTMLDMLTLVQRWHEEGRTILTVLHDMEQVRRHFAQTLLIACEPVAWGATAEILTEDNLIRARALRDAHRHKHAHNHAHKGGAAA